MDLASGFQLASSAVDGSAPDASALATTAAADEGAADAPPAAGAGVDGVVGDAVGADGADDDGSPSAGHRAVPWVDDAFEPGREAAARALLASRAQRRRRALTRTQSARAPAAFSQHASKCGYTW
jgi:hypothetical protein